VAPITRWRKSNVEVFDPNRACLGAAHDSTHFRSGPTIAVHSGRT
jgi:hypothetical protein